MIDARKNITKTTLSDEKGCTILTAMIIIGISIINAIIKYKSALAFSCIINEFSIYLAKK